MSCLLSILSKYSLTLPIPQSVADPMQPSPYDESLQNDGFVMPGSLPKAAPPKKRVSGLADRLGAFQMSEQEPVGIAFSAGLPAPPPPRRADSSDVSTSIDVGPSLAAQGLASKHYNKPQAGAPGVSTAPHAVTVPVARVHGTYIGMSAAPLIHDVMSGNFFFLPRHHLFVPPCLSPILTTVRTVSNSLLPSPSESNLQ